MPVSQTNPNVKAYPPQIWRTSEKIWLPVWGEPVSGTLIANSAGLLPVKPHYEQYAIAIYHIVKFKNYSDGEFGTEIDHLNNGGWRGWAANAAWISEIHTGGLERLGNSWGEEVHYVVRCLNRPGGWRFRHPDVGYTYEEGGEFKTFLTEDDIPYIGNLDGMGGKGSAMRIIFHDTKRTTNFNLISGLNGL